MTCQSVVVHLLGDCVENDRQARETFQKLGENSSGSYPHCQLLFRGLGIDQDGNDYNYNHPAIIRWRISVVYLSRCGINLKLTISENGNAETSCTQ